MTRNRSQADVYLEVACSVIAAKLRSSRYDSVGHGDVAADQRAARDVRAAARALFDEIADEMSGMASK